LQALALAQLLMLRLMEDGVHRVEGFRFCVEEAALNEPSDSGSKKSTSISDSDWSQKLTYSVIGMSGAAYDAQAYVPPAQAPYVDTQLICLDSYKLN
jgi:hypothetical protein